MSSGIKTPVEEVKVLIDELMVCALTCEQDAITDTGDENEMKQFIQLQHQCAEVCFQAAHRLIKTAVIEKDVLHTCIVVCRQYAHACEQNHRQHLHSACMDCVDACERYLRHTF